MHANNNKLPVKMILFIMLILVSFVTRFFYLERFPEGFHKDEAVLYNAYSLLQTGRDEYGRFLPVIFEALGDFRLPVSIYLAIPFVAVFGLSDFWMRVPSALIGSLTPIAVYFLSFKLFRSKIPAFLSAFLLAISPWHILFSRSGSLIEPVILALLTVLAVYFLLRLFDRWNISTLFLTTILFILTLFTYRTGYIFSPLIILYLIILLRKNFALFSKSAKKISSIGLFLFLLFVFYLLFSKGGNERLKHVGLQSSAEVKLILEEQIREDSGQSPLFITRLFHNKLFNFAITTGRNYFSHFDLSYLFFTGDTLSSINSTPFMGHLLFIDLPFFFLGFYFLTTRSKATVYFLIPIAWFIIGPMAAAFTVDSPSAVRSHLMVIGVCLITGYGLYNSFQFIKRRSIRSSIITVISLVYVFNFMFFLHQFSIHKRLNKPWYRDVGVKEVVTYTLSIQDHYRKVVFSDYPSLYIFLLYYGKVDPAFIQKQQVGMTFTNRFKELIPLINPKYMVMPSDCQAQGQVGVLYVCTKDHVPLGTKIAKVIRLADGLPAFTFLEFVQDFDPKAPPVLPDRLKYMEDSIRSNGRIIPSTSSRYL